MGSAILVALAMLLSFVRPAYADLTLTITSRSTGMGPATRGQQRVLASGRQMRIEPISGLSFASAAGGEMISDGDGWVVVDPESRTYWKHGHVSTRMRRFVNALLGWKEPRPLLTVDEIVVDRLREKDGGTILGHRTRLQRCRLRFRINTWGLMASSDSAPESVIMEAQLNEIWFAPSLQNETLRRHLLGTGFANVDEQLARALAAVPGLPLKRTARRWTQTGTTPAGEATNAMEVERIDLGNVPRSAFEPPAGYRRVRWQDALARQHAKAAGIPPR